MREEITEIVKDAAGIATFGISAYLVFRSAGAEDFILTDIHLLLLITAATILLYGPDKAVSVIRAIRGTDAIPIEEGGGDDE